MCQPRLPPASIPDHLRPFIDLDPIKPYIFVVFIHVPSVAWSLLDDIPSFIERCKLAFAVLNVPRCTRVAMAFDRVKTYILKDFP